MIRSGIPGVLRQVIVPYNDIPRVVIPIVDVQARQSRSIWYERRVNTICVDCVWRGRVGGLGSYQAKQRDEWDRSK
jgi:hypothetical protein